MIQYSTDWSIVMGEPGYQQDPENLFSVQARGKPLIHRQSYFCQYLLICLNTPSQTLLSFLPLVDIRPLEVLPLITICFICIWIIYFYQHQWESHCRELWEQNLNNSVSVLTFYLGKLQQKMVLTFRNAAYSSSFSLVLTVSS